MPPIEDYGLIGDTHSAGLVSRTGSIDWLCLPRFDSSACFAALLGDESAGHWRISPADGTAAAERRYRGDTLVLESLFETGTGRVKLTDCLALESSGDGPPDALHAHEVVVRIVEGLAGTVNMAMTFKPRFYYGDVVPWFRRHGDALEAVGGPDALDLVCPLDLVPSDGAAEARFEVERGDVVPFIAGYHPSHIPHAPPDLGSCNALMERTESFWAQWAARCDYDGRWRDAVVRSLLTLKALTYSPSGGVVAAPTTSLPEKLGGTRNWDYRYCWLRDSTFTLEVLLRHGYAAEAASWRDWLLRAVAGDPNEMQLMYGVLGERHLQELELDWLAGFEGSAPVRIGNAAHTQFQLDVYGELMDSFHSARCAGITGDEDWDLQRVIADFVCDHWRDPDEGIWEVRSGRRHFVHSKVMAWVAIDRAVRAVEDLGRAGALDRWRATRDEIRRDIFANGVHRSRGHFTRAYDEEGEVDASLLMLPLVGFVDAGHDLMATTIEVIRKDLSIDGLLLRYRAGLVDDGIPEGEGAFLMCTLWLVDCLVLLGRVDEAEKLFERILGFRNDLGLLSEEYDVSSGRMVGNFPQAFSHVALVRSATMLEDAAAAGRSPGGRRPSRRPAAAARGGGNVQPNG